MSSFGIFRQKSKTNKIKEYLEKDAIILDVRTIEEWNEEHIEGSKHIALSIIPSKIDEIISWKRPVIAVCRSGGRSEQATQFLLQNGVDVINGGPWENVDQHV